MRIFYTQQEHGKTRNAILRFRRHLEIVPDHPYAAFWLAVS
jgi:hypothetical protein